VLASVQRRFCGSHSNWMSCPTVFSMHVVFT
jgi:hypothetical protein